MGNNPYKLRSFAWWAETNWALQVWLWSESCGGKAWIGWWLWIQAIKAVGHKTELAIWPTGDCLKLLSCCGWARGEGDWPKIARCTLLISSSGFSPRSPFGNLAAVSNVFLQNTVLATTDHSGQWPAGLPRFSVSICLFVGRNQSENLLTIDLLVQSAEERKVCRI